MRDEKRRLQSSLVEEFDNFVSGRSRVAETSLDREVVVHEVVESDLNLGAVRWQTQKDDDAPRSALDKALCTAVF